MIKAKYLMVGDWVLADGEPAQVMELSVIGGDLILVMKPVGSYDVAYASNKVALASGAKNLKHIKPIPLTPEILKKFGFAEEQQKNHFIYDKIMIQRNCHNSFSFFIHAGNVHCKVCNLFSVHELQHILKLLNINKEIYLC